ncbi:hypothetical protein BDR03DRAFT_969208 [Suillus americanus]|nr:hypothetical protein BDR03DRAFT_969208 [Suillus americanus]
MHLVITGSNRVGKTAVVRALAAPWAPESHSMLRGSMHTDDALARPTDSAFTCPRYNADCCPGVFVIPQAPTGPSYPKSHIHASYLSSPRLSQCRRNLNTCWIPLISGIS